MKWEVKKLPGGKWGIFLCKKYWKFKDKPVMYAASISEACAQKSVDRLNNPAGFSNDENYLSVGQAREIAKKEKAAARELEKKRKAEARALAKSNREKAKLAKKLSSGK